MGFELSDIGDVASDVVDTIGDAGDLIGDVLKSIAPFLAAIPGIGTAFAGAVYAAGALAAKDKITDVMIGAASAAMPPGIPRIAFDGATNITRDVTEGRSVQDSALAACRQAAGQAGGEVAERAFDSGVAVISGERVDEQLLIEQGRALALQNGPTAAASYDAAISIAQGHKADQVVIDAARRYINEMGGSVALTAFDTAVALGYGKTLQEAGFIGLHTFARGNNPFEKILNFVEQVGSAKKAGIDVQQLLASELATDFLHALHAAGVRVDEHAVDTQLNPYVDAIRQNPELLEPAAGKLATQYNVNEAVIRAAQALMRRGDGMIDQNLLATIKAYAELANQGAWGQTMNFSEEDPDANEQLAVKGRQIISAGAKWRGALLSDIRKRSRFTMNYPKWDVLTQITIKETRTWDITDEWRRAFDIGIGTAEGASPDNNAQNYASAGVRRRLAGMGSNIAGFDAAEAIQFERTRSNRKYGGSDILSAQSIVGLAGVVIASSRREDPVIARHAQVVIQSVATRSELASNDPAATMNRAKWTQIMARKRLPIFAIPPGDEPKLINPITSSEPLAASIKGPMTTT